MSVGSERLPFKVHVVHRACLETLTRSLRRSYGAWPSGRFLCPQPFQPKNHSYVTRAAERPPKRLKTCPMDHMDFERRSFGPDTHFVRSAMYIYLSEARPVHRHARFFEITRDHGGTYTHSTTYKVSVGTKRLPFKVHVVHRTCLEALGRLLI